MESPCSSRNHPGGSRVNVQFTLPAIGFCIFRCISRIDRSRRYSLFMTSSDKAFFVLGIVQAVKHSIVVFPFFRTAFQYGRFRFDKIQFFLCDIFSHASRPGHNLFYLLENLVLPPTVGGLIGKAESSEAENVSGFIGFTGLNKSPVEIEPDVSVTALC